MNKTALEVYKEYVSEKLDQLSPLLQGYALGDFSRSIEVPDEEDEFTELLVGLNLMVDDLKEMIDEKERTITRLRKTEDELRLKDFVFRSSMTADSIGSTDGLITHANESFLRIWGYDSLDEVIGKPIPDFLANQDDTLEIITALTEQGTWEGEYTGKRKDGSTFTAQSKANVVRGEAGEVVGYYSAVVDITDRKEEQKALEESEERHRVVFDTLVDALVITDLTGHVVEVNPAACRTYGYRREEFIGLHATQLITPEYHLVFQDFLCSMEEVGSFAGETIDIRKDKATFNTEVRGSPILFKGEPHFLAIVRDVTELKKAERQILREKQISEKIIDSLPGLFFQISTSGKMIRWNKFFRTLTGLSDAEIRKLSPLHTVQDSEKERIGRAIEQAFSKGYGEAEVNLVSREGKQIPFFFSGTSQMIDKSPYMIGMGIDISKLKAAEEKLRTILSELEQSNRELERFAYVASHDLQEPLRKIRSFSDLLSKRYEGQLDEKADKYIGYIIHGTTRMRALINDLLAYSRVETREKPFESVNTETLIEGVLGNLQSAIRERGAVVSHDPLPLVKGDPSQLEQVFHNIMDNALKFHGEEPPRIHVSAREGEGEWIFSLSDNGIGMKMEYAERIFIIFQRLHARGDFPGTGIGLALSKKIIERHGGRIWVESEPGKGSTFFFTIPIIQTTKEEHDS